MARNYGVYAETLMGVREGVGHGPIQGPCVSTLAIFD